MTRGIDNSLYIKELKNSKLICTCFDNSLYLLLLAMMSWLELASVSNQMASQW